MQRLVGFILATAYLATNGLEGAGPWYALVLPIVALILVGVRAGILAAVLSALDVAVFAALVNRGVLVVMSWQSMNPLAPVSTFLMLLGIAIALLVLFHQFQVKTVKVQVFSLPVNQKG
ncbi:MAG: hypothetical protein ABSF99_04135 [Anaerolineales bacterium]|jgi:hypothetical protein